MTHHWPRITSKLYLPKYAQCLQAMRTTSPLSYLATTFSLIVRHRDYLFDRIEVLKSNEVKINQQLQSFSLSLQGTFPRLAGIAIGGTTLPLLISQVFPFLSSATSTLLLVLSGGIGYIAAELISGYIGGKGLNDAITKFENEKDTVYLEFMANSRSALRLLFNNVISSYANNAIDATYARTPQQRDEIVDNIMKAAMLKSPCSKCVSCGTALARNSNFCDKCGTKQTS